MVQRKRLLFRRLFVALLFAPLVGLTAANGLAQEAQEQAGRALLAAKCASCHEEGPDGALTRIGEMRKTPEGWDMTLARMMIVHDVALSRDERGQLVKYLADRQGLAPSETASFRYILERRPNVVEDMPEEGDLGVMCARCHSYARVALQRRDAEEWRKLSHFHMGQWPTIEYQHLGRDRNWWEIASQQVPDLLGKMFPLETVAWSGWAGRAPADLSGSWRVVGRRPGAGAYAGTMTVDRQGPDEYAVRYALTAADGQEIQGTGTSIVYSGYEWRGSTKLGENQIREVYALSEDGTALEGRWFLETADEIGGDVRAVRERDGHAEILAVEPGVLRAGTSAKITIHGTGLFGDVSLGEGVRIVETREADERSVTVVAEAAAEAATGGRTVAIGDSDADGMFAVYDRIDSVRVEPEYGIARVGGGPVPPVAAQFDAVGYLDGADGEPGTEDDVRLGVMPAEWSVENFNEAAAAMDDARYAGDVQTGGLFVPAVAGPNPERKYSTNNAGNVAVTATVKDGERTVEGSAHLIVTVQRWVDPPIR